MYWGKHDYFLDKTAEIAARSPMMRHRTGCIIVHRDKTIASNGWAHIPTHRLALRSMHAEMHALARGRYENLYDCVAYIVTLTRANNRTISQPCLDCAVALINAGIDQAIFSSSRYDHQILYLPTALKDLKVYTRGNN